MKVTLAMPFDGHQPDDTIDVDDVTGRDLLRSGWARTAAEAPQEPPAVDPDPEPVEDDAEV